ncbi:MAG: DMT family transporter [Hyphomicrobiales bacterium]
MESPVTETTDFAKGIALGLITVLIWGAWPVVTRLGVSSSFSPEDITIIRFAVSGLVLSPFFLRLCRSRVNPKALLIMAFCAGAPYVLVTSYGFTYAPASHGGIIIPSTMLIFTMIGSWLLFKDRPDRLRGLGYLITISGICAVGGKSLTVSSLDVLIGDVLFVLGGILWGSYTLANRYFGINAFDSSVAVCVISFIVYGPIYFITAPGDLADAPIFDIALQAIYQGLAIAIMGMVCFTRTVELLGASRGSLFAALVPASTMILAFPVLNEVPTRTEVAGLALVSTGMLLALGIFTRKKM